MFEAGSAGDDHAAGSETNTVTNITNQSNSCEKKTFDCRNCGKIKSQIIQKCKYKKVRGNGLTDTKMARSVTSEAYRHIREDFQQCLIDSTLSDYVMQVSRGDHLVLLTGQDKYDAIKLRPEKLQENINIVNNAVHTHARLLIEYRKVTNNKQVSSMDMLQITNHNLLAHCDRQTPQVSKPSITHK